MAKKTTRRTRLDPEDAAKGLLRDLVASQPGCKFETEMAGDWNCLGIAVYLPAECDPKQELDLANDLVKLLGRARAEALITCDWSAGIYKNGQLLRALDPRSDLAGMCSTCGHTQELGRGHTCAWCGSSKWS